MAMRVHKADWKAWMGHWIEPGIVCDLVVKYRQTESPAYARNAENKRSAYRFGQEYDILI